MQHLLNFAIYYKVHYTYGNTADTNRYLQFSSNNMMSVGLDFICDL